MQCASEVKTGWSLKVKIKKVSKSKIVNYVEQFLKSQKGYQVSKSMWGEEKTPFGMLNSTSRYACFRVTWQIL